MDDQSSALAAPTTPSEIGAATILTLPRFWAEDPLLWFLQIENKFLVHRISTQTRRFELLLDALPQEAISDVRDILMAPRSVTPYDDIKNALLKRLVRSEESRIQELLNSAELGDRRPTQFLRHLQKLLGEKAPSFDDAVLRELFLKRMPASVRIGLAVAHAQPLTQLAELADRILETSAATVAATRADVSSADITDLRSLIDHLTTEVAELRRRDRRRHSSPSSSSTRDQRIFRRRSTPATARAPSPTSDQASTRPCYFHRRFGDAARRCSPPCSWPSGNEGAGR